MTPWRVGVPGCHFWNFWMVTGDHPMAMDDPTAPHNQRITVSFRWVKLGELDGDGDSYLNIVITSWTCWACLRWVHEIRSASFKEALVKLHLVQQSIQPNDALVFSSCCRRSIEGGELPPFMDSHYPWTTKGGPSDIILQLSNWCKTNTCVLDSHHSRFTIATFFSNTHDHFMIKVAGGS